jgi:Alcohol dehydrogenase GroES-like domain
MSRPFLGRGVASIREPRPKVYCTLVLVEGAPTAGLLRPEVALATTKSRRHARPRPAAVLQERSSGAAEMRKVRGCPQAYEFPILLGHEGAGIVEEVGAAVTQLRPGDHVVMSWRVPCGAWGPCGRGDRTHCESPLSAGPRMRLAGSDRYVKPVLSTGTFTTRTIVDARQAIKIPDALALEQACLVSGRPARPRCAGEPDDHTQRRPRRVRRIEARRSHQVGHLLRAITRSESPRVSGVYVACPGAPAIASREPVPSGAPGLLTLTTSSRESLARASSIPHFSAVVGATRADPSRGASTAPRAGRGGWPTLGDVRLAALCVLVDLDLLLAEGL